MCNQPRATVPNPATLDPKAPSPENDVGQREGGVVGVQHLPQKLHGSCRVGDAGHMVRAGSGVPRLQGGTSVRGGGAGLTQRRFKVWGMMRAAAEVGMCVGRLECWSREHAAFHDCKGEV